MKRREEKRREEKRREEKRGILHPGQGSREPPDEPRSWASGD
jgi:hypothetical protein